MKKSRLLLSLIAIMLLVATVMTLFACGNESSTAPADPTPIAPGEGTIGGTDTDLTVTDLAGRTLLLNRDKIQKVVCVGAGSLRLYSYVADLAKIIAVEDIEKTRTTGRVSYRAYQIANEELFATLPSAGVGGPQAQILNKERLTELSPDVVFSCLSLTADELLDAERAIGCPIVTLKYGPQKAFSEELLQSLELIGKVMKTEVRATEVVDYIKSLKADLATIAQGKTSAKIYLGCNSNWGMKGFLSTSKNYPIFTVSGIANVMDGDTMVVSSDGYADLEAVVSSDADKIILDAGGLAVFKGEYEEVGGHLSSTLAEMKAFADKEVYLMMPNNAYDANVETCFINAYFALNVAYELDIDIRAKAEEITSFFLHKSLYDDIVTYGGYQKLDLPDVWPTK
ncbi:MAG: ABC transporter substrate-binding protein [Clostridia bacterium]|nr:ABC transporter substrate-binding protein [Clostridia bacterium]